VGDSADSLARALARAGVAGIEESVHAVKEGRVTVGGKVVRQPMMELRPKDAVKLDGRPVSLTARTLVVMFHKPQGCISSHAAQRGQPTVFDLLLPALPASLRGYGWHAVGRLDLDTTGILLFTNDEHFVEHGTSPQSKLPKRYVAKVFGKLNDAALVTLQKGIKISGVLTRPAKARFRPPDQVELTLTEGRFHQVKHMLGAVKLPVGGLHREAIGTVELDVPVGEARLLSDDEVEKGFGYSPRTFHPKS